MPPLIFEILMPPFFMPPPENLKPLCHPLLCHPQKSLCHPVYATPRVALKKGGWQLKKNQWSGGAGQILTQPFNNMAKYAYFKYGAKTCEGLIHRFKLSFEVWGRGSPFSKLHSVRGFLNL